MALYVYITKDCQADARRHNRLEEINRLKKKVEDAQQIRHFDNFPPPYLKKRFDRQIRLLAEYRTVTIDDEAHVVVCFLRIYVRSSNEYAMFVKSPREFGKNYLDNLVSQEDLETFLSQQIRENPVPPKSVPTEIENHFLYRFMGRDTQRETDRFICESERWLRAVSENDRVKNNLQHIFDELINIVGNTDESCIHEVKKLKIVYRWFPNLDKLFLAGIADNAPECEEIKQIYAEVLSPPTEEIAEKDILQRSMRAYPELLLAGDNDLWLAIQQDAESNLSLSPEETQVLESVHQGEGGFPIFINGRAGSGKSTVLYHLFADYVKLFLESKQEGLRPPLLLSCSDALRRRAHESVQKLLSHNPRYNEEGRSVTVPEACFQELQTLFLGLLSPEIRNERFPDDGHVGFADFRKKWNVNFKQSPRIKKIGADTSWHVIRTFIKGLDSEDYLTPEDYEHLPKKQKSVSLETYKSVFDAVFENWYKDLCEQSKAWDDQDLARYVFDQDLILPEYPVIFCDEAQDFTRIELDLVFRLSLFTDRQLDHTSLSRVPFAFAGDPFQTLNPTGFRWDAVQAMFHDKLVDALGKNIHRNIQLHYRDLSLNYRSTKNVVRLCNLIQALRSALFDLSELSPQDTWQMEETSPMPAWFERQKVADWAPLGQERDVMIIVNCMLNEEQECFEADPYLKQVIQVDQDGIPANVLSPTRAKGLEFGRVALYGFADSLPGDILGILDDPSLESDKLLPFEYFVNQLYVAASRPKRRLFIIDSQQGLERLWSIASDDTLKEKMWSRLADRKDKWVDSIGGFVPGTRDSWNEERGDPEEMAKAFEQEGLANGDSFLLRSAATLYESLGKGAFAERNRAYALEFENRFIEASEAFQRAGELDRGIQCLWKAGLEASKALVRLHESHPVIGRRIEYRLMEVYDNPRSETVLQVLEDLCERAMSEKALAARLVAEPTFKKLLCAYEDTLDDRTSSREDCRRILNVLLKLQEFGLRGSRSFLANIYCRLGEPRTGITIWEEDESYLTDPRYREAKALDLSQRFEAEEAMQLSALESRWLFEHYIENEQLFLASRCASVHGTTGHLMQLLEKLAGKPEIVRQVLFNVAVGLCRLKKWQELISLTSIAMGREDEKLSGTIAETIENAASDWRLAFVAACGRSHEVRQLPDEYRRELAEQLQACTATIEEWKDILSVQVVGSSFEQVGWHIYTLNFYEKIRRRNGFSSEDDRFSRTRWVATKEKQADREKSDSNIRNRYEAEAKIMRDRFRLGTREFSEFPSVDIVWLTSDVCPNGHEGGETPVKDGEVSRPKPGLPADGIVTCTVGGFRFEFVRSSGRVNLTEVVTGRTAQITASPLQFGSLDVLISENGSLFVCEQWNCSCQFEFSDGMSSAILDLPDCSLQIRFDLKGDGGPE